MSMLEFYASVLNGVPDGQVYSTKELVQVLNDGYCMTSDGVDEDGKPYLQFVPIEEFSEEQWKQLEIASNWTEDERWEFYQNKSWLK